MIIGTDVDNTIIHTGKIWLKWLEVMFGKRVIPKHNIDYNLDNYFKQDHEDTDYALTADWFFNRVDLYANKRLSFVKSAEEVCKRLGIRGHSVVAITDCTPNNLVSKLVMCKKAFAMDKVYRTADKAKIKCDFFIDDRNEHLNQFLSQPDTILIKMDTPYIQYEELLPEVEKRVITVGGLRPWDSIYKLILEEELRRQKEDS